MKTGHYFKLAWLLGTAPLVVGISIFIAWLLWRDDASVSAGIITIFAGLGCVVVGIVCVAIHATFSWRSEPAGRGRLVWRVIALLGLYTINFVVAGSIVVQVVLIQTCYTVSIVNQSSLPLQDVQIVGGGMHVRVGDVPPGQTAAESFWIEHDGELTFQAMHASDKIVTTVEGYVTHNMGGNKAVTFTASNQVKVESRPAGLWQ